jgi:peroxiredoxin
MPSLEKLHRRLKDRGLRVVGISVDESLELVKQFQQEHELSFTILYDEGAKVAHGFKTFKYPETYVVDREGKLTWKIIGPRDWLSADVVPNLVGLLESENQASQSNAKPGS